MQMRNSMHMQKSKGNSMDSNMQHAQQHAQQYARPRTGAAKI
jgi:hypothetical protein